MADVEDRSEYEAIVTAALERQLATPDEDGNVMSPEEQAELLAILRQLPTTEELFRERESATVELVRDRTAAFGPALERVLRLARSHGLDDPGPAEVVWRDPTPR